MISTLLTIAGNSINSIGFQWSEISCWIKCSRMKMIICSRVAWYGPQQRRMFFLRARFGMDCAYYMTEQGNWEIQTKNIYSRMKCIDAGARSLEPVLHGDLPRGPASPPASSPTLHSTSTPSTATPSWWYAGWPGVTILTKHGDILTARAFRFVAVNDVT